MSLPEAGNSFRFNAEALKDLPRKDHRWIVFLRSVDEVDHIPKVKPLVGDRWYIPFDEAMAAALRAGVAEFAWGEELSGLRLGLRVRPGDEAVVEIAMENVGKKDKTILQFRGHYFDDWELLEITATGPDGKSWRLERIGPPKKEFDVPTHRVLKPGEKYVHAVRPTRWVTPPDRGGGGNAPADLFTPGKDFRISLSYTTTDGQLEPRWWVGRLTAGPVTLTIPKAEEWGQPAGDFRARLRLPKRTYSAGEPLAFELDLRNDGKAERELTPIPYRCEVEVDGRPFGYFGAIRYKCLPKKLLPGVPLLPFLEVTNTATWTAEPLKTDTPDRRVPLVLAPGKHIVRVAFPVGDGVRVVSNSLEIEVGPDTWGLAAGGIQSRLRLDQVKFKAGEPLAFTLDLRNRGEKAFSEAPVPYSCAIEFDGETYTYSGPIGYGSQIQTIEPAGHFDGWVNVTTDKLWVYTRRKVVGNQVNLEAVPLKLTVGKHKVRVAYQMTAPNAMKPVSNTVEFEVEAAGLLKANEPAK